MQYRLDVGERRAEPGQVRAGDRVDEHGPRPRAAELDQVGLLPVAVTGGALSVDGDRAGARGEPGGHRRQVFRRRGYRREALGGLKQVDDRGPVRVATRVERYLVLAVFLTVLAVLRKVVAAFLERRVPSYHRRRPPR